MPQRNASSVEIGSSSPTGSKQSDVDVLAAVRSLSLALERWRVAFAKRHRLAENDSVVLSHLVAAKGRLLPRELATAMKVRTGTLTTMLDRLENVGFVRRIPNPDDRRSNFIEITTAGIEAMANSHNALGRRIRAAVPKELHADLVNCLGKLTSTIDAVVTAQDKGPA